MLICEFHFNYCVNVKYLHSLRMYFKDSRYAFVCIGISHFCKFYAGYRFYIEQPLKIAMFGYKFNSNNKSHRFIRSCIVFARVKFITL